MGDASCVCTLACKVAPGQTNLHNGCRTLGVTRAGRHTANSSAFYPSQHDTCVEQRRWKSVHLTTMHLLLLARIVGWYSLIVAPSWLFVGSLAVTVKLPHEEDCRTMTKQGRSACIADSPSAYGIPIADTRLGTVSCGARRPRKEKRFLCNFYA